MENLIPIGAELIKRIKLLFQLQIGTDDDRNFPKNICLICFDSVNTSWSFFKRITRAQEEFHNRIKSESNIRPDSSLKRNSVSKNKIENTIIFQEISIVPIETNLVSNENIHENHSSNFKFDTDLKAESSVKCPLSSSNSAKLYSEKSEISSEASLKDSHESLSASDDFSNSLEKSSNRSGRLKTYSESYNGGDLIPVGLLKRKLKLKNSPINAKQIETKSKLAILRSKRAKSRAFKKQKKGNKTFPKASQVRSLKKSTKDYHLDPGDVWPDYPWTCNVCSAKCTDIHDYKNHSCYQLHKRFFCADCPKTLVRPEQFFQHVSEVHWERFQRHLLLQCDECQVWFPTLEAQEEHRSSEHPNAPTRQPLPESHHKNPYQCDQCDKDCKTRSQLTNHLKVHSKDKPHACDVCGKAYFYPSSLLEHKKLHNKSRDFICEQCGRGFYNKGTLKAHKQTHLDINDRELPFACSFCNKRFANRCKLRYHEMVHTGAKPFICDICGRNFRLRDSLKGHVAIVHSEEKSHSCSCCDMKFKTATNLSAHMRQHTGEHPYACTECPKTFSNYSNCDKHMKRIHNLTLKGRVNLAKICATLRKETEDT